ncbi:MAG: hypothetical protein J0H86_02185 [Xanthomonadaceae bacterium]|nr:hypothetical protein [Xanthomonadaceae bacterium]
MNFLSAMLQLLHGIWSRLFRPRYSAPVHSPTRPTSSAAASAPPTARHVPVSSSSARCGSSTNPRAVSGTGSPPASVAARSHPPQALRSSAHPLSRAADQEQPPHTAKDAPAGKRFRLGQQLGRAGGQGTVFELLNENETDLVYKLYRTPIRGALQSLDELVRAGRKLAPLLERKGITATWPTAICGDRDVVEGYVMRRIPPQFKIELQTPYRKEHRDATLDQAFVAGNSKFSPTQPVTADERMQLLRLVGTFLDTLHRNDFVYGDLSLKNMLFSRTPTQLLVMDMDGVRKISARLIPEKDLLHTPDWKDPLSPDQIPLGFDLDRYKFALLVYRLLVANSVSAPLPKARESSAFTNIGNKVNGRLGFLLRRAAVGEVGSRPPINEWLDALDSASS